MIEHENKGSETLRLFAAILALALTTTFFAPLTILASNIREISLSPIEVVTFITLPGLAILTAMVIPFLAFPPSLRRAAGSLLIGAAGALYLQGNWFTWDYGLFDGGDIDWQSKDTIGFIELAAWFGIISLALYFRSAVWKNMFSIASAIILMQAAALALQSELWRSPPGDQPGTVAVAKTVEDAPDDGLYDFSSAGNVLVIIADTLSGATLSELLEDDPRIAGHLEGFTSYDNTLGVSPYTLLSIPSILSSVPYENAGTIQSFMTTSLGDDSLAATLSRNGYSSKVITMGLYKGYLQWLPSQHTTSVLQKNIRELKTTFLLQILDLVSFRYSPHVLKQKVYRDHQWLLQGMYINERVRAVFDNYSKGVTMEPSPVHLASRIIAERFVNQGRIRSSDPTFKFVHLFTSHTPYIMDSDGDLLSTSQYESIDIGRRGIQQARYALTEISNILKMLRRLDIYDQTLVIVAADHGSDIRNPMRPDYMRRSHPMLLVKPMHRRGPLKRSSIPSSLLDIPLTVTDALGIDSDFSGYSLLDDEIPQDRKRYYYYFNWNSQGFWKAEYLPDLEKYEVTGDVTDPRTWNYQCGLENQREGNPGC